MLLPATCDCATERLALWHCGLCDAGLKLYGGSAFAPSPLLHLQLAAPSGDEDQDQATCARIVEHMRVHAGILAAASR